MPRLRRSADSTTSGRTDPVHVRWRRLGRTSVDHVPQQRPNSVETYRSSPAPSLDSDPATEQQEQPIQVEAPQHIVRYVPKRFEVDCSDFRPENVRVQVIDNRLVVEARQEQINDSGYVCMELAREFNLTDRFDLANITCRLTADGQLHIEVPCAITRPNEAIESSETETLVPDSSEASVELERITDAGQSEQLNLNPTETDTVSEPAEEQSSINVATETESESISETTHNLESATESQRIVEEEPQPQSCTESSVQSGAN